MYIKVALKSPGNLTKRVAVRPFFLSQEPHTVDGLLCEVVRTSVEAYLSRETRTEPFVPLDDEQLAGMGEVGKFAWLLPVDTRPVDLEKALAVARTAMQDGLVRVFQNERELTSPDDSLVIHENDVFTFVRLTLLSGRMW